MFTWNSQIYSPVVYKPINNINYVVVRQLSEDQSPNNSLPYTLLYADANNMTENGLNARTLHNPYVSKWNALFDKTFTQWISFKPSEGLKVYPCYSCRDMFGSKNSFLDHVNRRGMLIVYKCPFCRKEITFYNPCTLLLHARTHYTASVGDINLDNVKISVLPIGIAGFFQHPDIPVLYNVQENDVGDSRILNTRFYTPDPESEGRRDISLRPVALMFYQTTQDKSLPPIRLVLKQISSNIPFCKFELFEKSTFLDNTRDLVISEVGDAIKEEVMEDYDTNVQIIEELDKILEDNNTEDYYPRCPECSLVQTSKMIEHFMGNNKPTDENLKCNVCKYIATSKCSLSAHERIHSGILPFVCPECGKAFTLFRKLLEHLDEVCFHLTKHVRYRCPGRNCSKIFAASVTFATHFRIHMQLIIKCNDCTFSFHTMSEFLEHNKIHADSSTNPAKYYKCTVCNDKAVVYTQSNCLEHVNKHCTDGSQRVYVFTCKYCKNYFRSSQTYAIHLLKCSKKHVTEKTYEIVDENEIEMIVSPTQRANALNNNVKNTSPPTASIKCVICNQDFSLQEIHQHIKSKVCQKLAINDENCVTLSDINKYVNAASKSLNSSSSEISISSNNSKHESIGEDDKKKKRKRANTKNAINNKKIISIDQEKQQIFDGTYYCNICDFKQDDRKIFHEHIVEHKNVSTLYQCMECGECFVVKPSLLKHLMYFHQIYDTDQYLQDNDCFDEIAVQQLVEQPNQCKICRLQCDDEFELKKHFRVHGMAFLSQKL